MYDGRSGKSWRGPSKADRRLDQSNEEKRLCVEPRLSICWRNDHTVARTHPFTAQILCFWELDAYIELCTKISDLSHRMRPPMSSISSAWVSSMKSRWSASRSRRGGALGVTSSPPWPRLCHQPSTRTSIPPLAMPAVGYHGSPSTTVPHPPLWSRRGGGGGTPPLPLPPPPRQWRQPRRQTRRRLVPRRPQPLSLPVLRPSGFTPSPQR